ncbi:MAG: orotidine-5'-phosphate decarboxylase [Bacteroidales bacterium]
MTYDTLYEQIKIKKTCLCVGLDTDLSKIPVHIAAMPHPIFEFNRRIIEATAPYCVAYKLNTAFYEAEGVEGWEDLEKTVKYIKEKYPEIFIIADAKRGDIGNTAVQYAKAFFTKMDFDAVTLSPYMGFDTIKPFLKYKDKWVIILALTSNKSADQFETLQTIIGNAGSSANALARHHVPLYEKVIRESINSTEEYLNIDGTDPLDTSMNHIMFVVGATKQEKLSEIRKYCPNHFLLVPGVGAQGGSLDSVLKYGRNSKVGLLINSSRGIIYASTGKDFTEKAAEAASKFRM